MILKRYGLALILLNPGLALASVSLGTGTGIFAKVASFMQQIVDFLGGPGTLFVVFVASVAAIALWVFEPSKGERQLLGCLEFVLVPYRCSVWDY